MYPNDDNLSLFTQYKPYMRNNERKKKYISESKLERILKQNQNGTRINTKILYSKKLNGNFNIMSQN